MSRMMHKILTALLLAGLIAASVWAWRQMHDPRTLPFHEVRIEGRFEHLNALQLRQQVKHQINGGFFALNMPALKENLMSTPWVEDVAVRRAPGVLTVSIREQRPVARWNDQFLFNSQGRLFLAPSDAPAGLPLLQGPSNSEQTVLMNYRKINEMLKQLNLQVKVLCLTERGGWEMTMSNGVAVTMSREDPLNGVRQLVRWYSKMAGDSPEGITHIDLRYQNSIAVERSNPL